jgi:mRNA-degrading endonuclease toxin of MazEF toxin-antitoxin module
MQSPIEVRYGEIWLYDPPGSAAAENAAAIGSSGSEQSGLRPHIIVSRDIVNKGKPTAVGVPLTTKMEKANSYRVALPAGELIATDTYSFQNSVALCDHVRVIDTSRLRKKIGKATGTALLSVGLGLAYVFDIR